MIITLKTDMVVGWFEVELWVVRGSLWYGACEERAWVLRGSGDTHWACSCSSHYSFPFSPRFSL